MGPQPGPRLTRYTGPGLGRAGLRSGTRPWPRTGLWTSYAGATPRWRSNRARREGRGWTLGVLERTDRVWASDNIDPIDRARIVMGLATLLPLELIGAHVASERSKTTGRRHDLAVRLIVALFGHQGIEWDITTTTSEERRGLSEWAALAKSFRPLLYGGELVRIERPSDPGTALFGVVAEDRSEALFALVRAYASPESETAPLRLDGLSPLARYLLKRLRLPGEGPHAPSDDRSRPEVDDAIIPGSLLMSAGVPAPFLCPEQAALFYLSEQPR